MGQIAMMTSRKITKAECPWLPRDVPAGTLLYVYRSKMDNSATFNMRIYTELPDDKGEVFVLPNDALEIDYPNCD